MPSMLKLVSNGFSLVEPARENTDQQTGNVVLKQYRTSWGEMPGLSSSFVSRPEGFFPNPPDKDWGHVGHGIQASAQALWTNSFNKELISRQLGKEGEENTANYPWIQALVVKKEVGAQLDQSSYKTEIEKYLETETGALRELNHKNVIRLLEKNETSLILENGGVNYYHCQNRHLRVKVVNFIEKVLNKETEKYVCQDASLLSCETLKHNGSISLAVYFQKALTVLGEGKDLVDEIEDFPINYSWGCGLAGDFEKFVDGGTGKSVAEKARNYLGIPRVSVLPAEDLEKKWREALFEGKRGSYFTFGENMYIFYQVANAMKYLHSKEIEHMDFKSHNLVLGKEGRAKLIDFDSSARKGEEEIFGEEENFGETDIGSFKECFQECLRLHETDPEVNSEKMKQATSIARNRQLRTFEDIVEKLSEFSDLWPQWEGVPKPPIVS